MLILLALCQIRLKARHRSECAAKLKIQHKMYPKN